MALDTYANLKTSVADWLNRTDLTAVVPDYITLAEAQISRRLVKDGPVREMMGRSDATINTEFITVPTDFMGARAMYLGTNYLPLEYVDPEEIVRRKTLYVGQSGDPQVYSVVGAQLQFWPWNAGTFTGELTYWKRIPALSNTNATNWLLTLHPDAYLYGSLLQAAPYLKDDARVAVWSSGFETVLADIVMADKIARTSTNLAVQPVLSGTP